FAPTVARHSGNRDLLHSRMRLQHELHLTGIDVEAARDDQLLDPAANGQGAVVADLTDVARAKKAVRCERLGRRLRVAPVTGEDLATFEQDLVELAQPHFDSRKGMAHAPRL